MATRHIATKLTIDGADQYKKQLREISSGMSVLKSEMNKVSAEFTDNANSVEALTKKNDVLERQMLTQKDKITTLREALQKSAEAYGENDKRTQDWQIKLNNAEADLSKMENQLKKNNAAIKSNGEETSKASKVFETFAESNSKISDSLSKVADEFGIRIPNGVSKALNSLVKMSPSAVLATSGIAALVAGLVTAEKKLMATTKESASRADDLLTESLKTGIDTETLQKWDYASQLIDVDVSTISSSMTKLIQNMNKAKNGNESLTATFESLGVEIRDGVTGELRNSQEVFFDAIDALGNIENATERDAVSMELFGKSAQDLNPLIINGADALKKYSKEAEENSAVLSGDQLEALGKVDDAQQRLLETQQAVADQISSEYAPYMEDALNKTRECILKVGDAVVESGVVDALGAILTTFTDMLTPLSELTSDLLPALGTLLQGIAQTIAWIADTINAGIGVFTYLFDGGERWSTALGLNPNKASNLEKAMYGSDYKTYDYYYNSDRWQYSSDNQTEYSKNQSVDMQAYYIHPHEEDWYTKSGSWGLGNATGTDNFRGGMTWVGENGPELVTLPRGSAISTAQESRNYGGDIFNITISASNVKEFNDIINMAQNQRRMVRMGGAY